MSSTIAPFLAPTPADCVQVSDPISFLCSITSAYGTTDNIVVAQYMWWNHYWTNNKYSNDSL